MHVAKLITVNWGLLAPREFTFEQAVLLSGANGAGKTTLVDAMQSIMSGTLHGVMSYNRAQGEATQTARDGKSKRTLGSYILGTDEGFRKHQHGATGYVAMVFKPSGAEKVPTFTAILGARVIAGATQENVDTLRLWLLAGEAQLSDFCQATAEGHTIQALENMTTHLRLTYGSEALQKFDDSKKEYLCALYARLQGSKVPVTLDEAVRSGRTWCSLIGVKGELGNVHLLVRNELLAAPDMGDEVRRSADIMKGVRMVRQDFERLSKTELALADLVTSVDSEIDAVLQLSRAKLSEAEEYCLTLEDTRAKIQSVYDDHSLVVETATSERSDAEVSIAALQTAYQDADRAYSRAAEENGEARLLERVTQLETVLKPVQARLGKVEQTFSPTRFIAETTEVPCKALSSVWPKLRALSGQYQEALIAWKGEPLSNPEHWLNHAQAIQEALRSPEGLGEAMAQQYDVSNKLNELTKEITAVKDELNHAEAGAGSLPREIAQLKDDIARLFPNSRPKVVAECVEVLDKHWQPAIEAYLGKSCYALLVSDQHEIAVAKYLNGVQMRRDVQVIQGSKLKGRKTNIDNGSVMEFLDVTDPIVERFLANKLGRVQAAVSQDALQYMDRGLTADGYSVGGDVWQRKMDVSRAAVFGANAGVARLADLKEQLATLEERKAANQKNQQALKETLALLQPMSQLDLPELTDYQATLEQLDGLKRELAAARNEDRLAELRLCRDEAKRRQDEALLTLRQSDMKVGRAQAELDTLTTRLRKIDEELAIKKAAYEAKKDGMLTQLQLLPAFDVEAWMAQSPADECAKLERILIVRHTAVDSALREFNEDADSLLVTPEQSAETGLDDLPRLIEVKAIVSKRLASLRDIDIQRAAERLRASEISFSSTFTSTFCDRVLSQVEAGKRELEAINQSLKKLVCQGESFQIIWDKDPSMSGYLGLFNALQNILDDRSAGNIFQAAGLSEEHAKLASHIYSLLLSDNDVVAERELSHLADYRNYMRFDILRKTATGHTDKLSTWGTGSGGQLATPVTVIRAAVLASACKLFDTRKASHLRMLAMDEAFARLDGQRTAALMNFLTEQLGLQVFCAMPTKDAPMIRGSFNMEYEFLKTVFDAGGVRHASTDVRFTEYQQAAVQRLEKSHIQQVTEAAKKEFQQSALF